MDDLQARELVARVDALLEEVEGFADPAARDKTTELVGALLDLYGDGLARLVARVAEPEALAGRRARLAPAPAARDPSRAGRGAGADGARGGAPLPRLARRERRAGGGRGRDGAAADGGQLQRLPVLGGDAEAGDRGRDPKARPGRRARSRPRTPRPKDSRWRPRRTGADRARAARAGRQNGNGGGRPPVRCRSCAPTARVLKDIAGEPVLFLRVDGTFYAYRPNCPGCGHSLEDGELRAAQLRCSGCGHSYSVRAGGQVRGLARAEPDAAAPAGGRRRHGEGGRRMTGSRLRELAQRSRAVQREAQEHCELCGEPIPAEHRHVLDLSTRDLRCACRPCSLLFDRPGAGGGHYRLVPERRLRLTGFELVGRRSGRSCASPSTWPSSSTAAPPSGWSRSIPGPMGATESLLELSAWEAIESANPVLAGMEPDVEALLVNRARGARDSLARPDRRLLRARGTDPHAVAGPDGRQGRLGGDRALLRRARPALAAQPWAERR